tara:strand:+ start:2798 stop:3307 length:510 start_codon:yes stop_codon:yes gene_type:complete
MESSEAVVASKKLSGKWTLWAHLPHDTDWSLNSYKKIMTTDSLNEISTLYKKIPEKMVQNCMLFLMRENIKPIWEDKKNRGGGCFSYKVNNQNVFNVWKRLGCLLVTNCITREKNVLGDINGITISPKKSFCIVKIWLSNCKHQNPAAIAKIKGLNTYGCIFKKHKPEY